MHKSKSFLLILTLIFMSCSQIFDEKSTFLKEIKNSDKTRKAILFLKNGNATTNDSFHVTICSAENKISNEEIGNVLTSELKTDSIRLKWLNNKTLQIFYPKTSKIFRQETEVNGVKIEYKVVN